MATTLNSPFISECWRVYGDEIKTFNAKLKQLKEPSTDSILLYSLPSSGGLSPLFDTIKKIDKLTNSFGVMCDIDETILRIAPQKPPQQGYTIRGLVPSDEIKSLYDNTTLTYVTARADTEECREELERQLSSVGHPKR